MALLHTPAAELGTSAPDFTLPDPAGRPWRLIDCRGERGTLVMFICNHCPYVKAILPALLEDVRVLQASGIGVVAIMPNDFARYAEDSPQRMQELAQSAGFTFPYLVDETQATARAYGAVCTPDFFGYDRDLRLQYRGRLDATTPSRATSPDMRRELREAMLAIAGEGRCDAEQVPSMGCSIKWR
jgi:peroxiredoxin